MDNINLDINNYTSKELESLLKLPNNYNREVLYKKKDKLQNTIMQSNVSESKKQELLIFLDNIKNRLLDHITNHNNPNPKHDQNTLINYNYDMNQENIKSIIRKSYTIDSLFRKNHNNRDNQSHNYLIQLPESINKAITMSISSLEIPLTYHNISEQLNNHKFTINVYDNGNTLIGTADIELLPGLYESRFTSQSQIIASNIETEVNNQIQKITDPNLSDIVDNLSFRIDKTSGFSMFNYENSNAQTIDLNSNYKIEIDFNVDNDRAPSECINNEIYQKLGWQLGFKTDKIVLDSSNVILQSTTADVNMDAYASVLSNGICIINYPRYLYIAIDDFQTSSQNLFSIASDSIVAPNIVGRINILSMLEKKTAYKQGAEPGDFFQHQQYSRKYFGPTDINKLRIQLLDEYGRPFSINNMDWSFVLSFDCFYN